MKYSQQNFSCFTDEKVEQIIGKVAEVKYSNGNKLSGTITGPLYCSQNIYERGKSYGQTKYMGIIINKEKQVAFRENIEYITIDEENVIDRRGFFKKAAETALPVIAGIVLSPYLLSSCEKKEPSCSGCANGCDNSCYRSCRNTCSAGCGDGCKGGCATNCVTANCKGGCRASCGDSCSASCVTWQS